MVSILVTNNKLSWNMLSDTSPTRQDVIFAVYCAGAIVWVSPPGIWRFGIEEIT